MEKIEAINYRGFNINIYPDNNAISPVEYGDDNLFLVHYHRDFKITNDKIISEDDVCAWYQGKKIDQQKQYHIFAVSAFIHSGVWLSLNQSFAADGGGWDTSHVGAVLVNKKEFPTKAKAVKAAQSLIENWNDYLSGNVYGYLVEDEGANESGGVWGFYGDFIKSGLLESARAEVDDYIASLTSEHIKTRKAQIKAGAPLYAREAFSLTV